MALFLASAVFAVTSGIALEDLVKTSLKGGVAVGSNAEGVYNCPNKCQNLLGFLSYMNAQTQQANGGNNEYRGCVLGCNKCGEQRDNNEDPNTCFEYCKNYVYTSGDAGSPNPIEKGIIEPDKACIIGCVINLCQGLCTGNNQWSNTATDGGCQIMTGYGVQTYSENTNAQFDPCCSLLQNVCTYQGPKTGSGAKNYNAIVNQAHKGCKGIQGILPSSTPDQMCTAYQQRIVTGEC